MTSHRSRFVVFVLFLIAMPSAGAFAQTESATISGRVVDQQGALLSGAQVELTNTNTGATFSQFANKNGLYVLTGLRPGHYRLTVSSRGFRTVNLTNLVLNVQDSISQNFVLQLGSVAESVTVVADESKVNTEDASISTLVDRNFAENLPMNGRSFQTLIQLAPGVVLAPSNSADTGQFSINGQRAVSNYWMVDGASANVGISTNSHAGNGLSGAAASLSVLGGTNGLVSVDAMQEFRIETSSYAPEFGRTPGGQISIVTRSGANQWHGTAFDYFRNDVLDANDWFANANKLPRPEERQNDFGGTFSGPILKDRTFFFFSYEGLRLRLPQVVQSPVPDQSARRAAIAAVQPYLNAFPLPTPGAADDTSTGISQFNASFSNSSQLDAYSLRVDHRWNNKLSIFGRYGYSPSTLVQRGYSGVLSVVNPATIKAHTATVGATWTMSQTVVSDTRVNYSRTAGTSRSFGDTFGGAVPLVSLPFPSPFNSKDGVFQFFPLSLGGGLNIGPQGENVQRQINIVENISAQKGTHRLKFGLDFRRLSPLYDNPPYQQEALFADVPSAASGNAFFGTITSSIQSAKVLFRNWSWFVQDTWRATPRFTLTYGLRWDLDVAPSSKPNYLAVTGFSLSDLSRLAIAPAGTPPYKTPYGSFAPRVGVAYQASDSQTHGTVVRGGVGLFYDLASSEAGNLTYSFFYPFGAAKFLFGANFPYSSNDSAPPDISLASVTSGQGGFAFDPNLKLPYTVEWNLAAEQSLGTQQTLAVSYVGAAGQRLLQSAVVLHPSASFSKILFVTNSASSQYNALQAQFKRRLSKGLQIIASQTWAHAVDDASAGSYAGNPANLLVPGFRNLNRGPSDFDIRNAFSAAITYGVPSIARSPAFVKKVVEDWSFQSFFSARTALPVTVSDGAFFLIGAEAAEVRPDVIPGAPLYLHGSQYPGGKAFNNTPFDPNNGCIGAFCPPPLDANGNPTRQGNLGRNTLRGFGAWQWDFAVHRGFRVSEGLKLEFRAELFNVLNHPNFAPPVSDISNQSQFGLSTQMLNNYLGGGNLGGGSFSPLYQTGGPRSTQLALKLQF